MVDVFEQVEEELRSDRYKRLARQWLPLVGGVLAVALVAALAWWGWDSWQTGRAEQASIAYQRGVEAAQAGNSVGAAAAFAEAEKKGNGAYRALALMQQAGLAVEQGRTAEAVELLDRAAKAAGDPVLADPARFKALLLVMDTGTLEDIEARAAPLTGEGRPMRAFALEAQGLARMQHGKMAEAQEIFAQLQYDISAPDSVRERARAALGQIRSGTAANVPAIVNALKNRPVEAPAQGQVPAVQPAPAAQ